MRLIDADALHYSRIRIYHDSTQQPGGYNAVVMSAEIKDAPTIDAVPVRTGRWIDVPFGYVCTACKGFAKDEIAYAFDDIIMPTYCPLCGAKMDAYE